MSSTPGLTTTADRLKRLKTILQEELAPGSFEELAAALLSELLGVAIAVAKSGFQHGGDAGPAGRQGRTFRIETKRYADTTSLSDRELLGEVDHAVSRDPAIEAWFLVATRAAPEQLEQDLHTKSDKLGLPILVIDWKSSAFPALAALCTRSPDVLQAMVSKEAGDLARSLAEDGRAARERLTRDLESWNLGFERLRTLSHERLTTIWTTPRTSIAALGQDVAGGHHHGTIRRRHSFSALSTWWAEHATSDAPATVIGWEGVGKTWAVLDWLTDRQEELPIVLVVPSSSVAGLAGASKVAVKQFVGERLHELAESRDPAHWHMRFERLLLRPLEEGPVITIHFDGMNQEPSVPWLDLIRVFQDTAFAGRVRLILTTRKLHFTNKLNSLRGLFAPPKIVAVDIYDDEPGGEFDQRLLQEGLSRSDLHRDLIPLARTPRLFNLVLRLRNSLVEAGQVTVHRLLWEYGRDTVGTRAGKSFSEEEWRSWLQEIAQRHLAGTRDYNLRELGDTAHRSDLTPTDVFRRLSDIVDAQFTILTSSERHQITPTLVTHALAAALLADLDGLSAPNSDEVERRLAEWFDPIDGLDEKAEILRAGVSILLERDTAETSSTVLSSLVLEWLRSQNVPDEHRSELASLATPLCGALLSAIEQTGDRTHKSARLWAVNAIRAIPRSDMGTLAKIVERVTGWLRTVSRDVDPPKMLHEESEKARAKRLIKRIGFDSDGEHIVLGHRLTFVERQRDTAVTTIPSLLEGFALEPALPVFEASALAMAIRGRQEDREGLSWLCLLNDVDFEETAASLRTRATEIADISPEAGVHPDLPRRVAALLLWLTGDESDEAEAAKLNPPLDQNWSYEEDYEAKPATSFFQLERRHARQVLQDRSLAIHHKIERTKRFFYDPNFLPPPEFSQELRRLAADFDASALDTSRFATAENNAFESLAPVLARCAPEALADLVRRKLSGLATRPAEQRLAVAAHATESLLLVTDEGATAARGLRLRQREAQENDEAYVSTELMILEIQGLAAIDQITTIIEADLKCIYSDLGDVLKPLSSEDAEALAQRYSGGTKKQISDLVLLMSQSLIAVSDSTWQWLTALALDCSFGQRGVAFKILQEADSRRFGEILARANWRWRPDDDMWSNHYGSLALIDATAGVPFEQSMSAIAPWLLLRAVSVRGGSAADAQLAAEVLDMCLCSSGEVAPEFGSNLSVYSESRKTDPFSFSLSFRPEGDDSPFSAFQGATDPQKYREVRERALKTTVDQVRAVRQSGAKLYLHTIDASDFEPIIRHVPDAVAKWLEGAEQVTPDFKRRVRLAEGTFIALCEALLTWSPDQGVALWRGLRKALVTRYLGGAQIDEMIHMLFRLPNAPEVLRQDQLSIAQTNTDQALLELAIAAGMNDSRAWLDQVIGSDLASGTVWRRQRAGKLAGFTAHNTLPVSDAWPEGPPEDLREFRQRETARWRNREACARHWWDVYWSVASDAEAYAAWVLFLGTADRRAYEWMAFQKADVDDASQIYERRLAHFQINERELKSAMDKKEKELDDHFLGRKTVEGVGPWGRAIE